VSVVVPRASARRRVALLRQVVRRSDRRLAWVIGVTLVLSAVAGAVQSLAVKGIVDAAVDRRWGPALGAAVIGAVGAGLIGAAGRAMGDTQQVVTNQVGLQVDRDTLEVTAAIPGIEHLERPDYLDQLALVRSEGQSLMRAVFALTAAGSLGLSMAAALWLLGALHPLLLALPVAAVPAVVLVPRSQRAVDHAAGVAAERQRAAAQLHGLFLAPAPATELRVFDASARLDRRADELWREVSAVRFRGAARGAAQAALGWGCLAGGYVAALLLTAQLAIDGRATAGDIVLVSQLALLLHGDVARTATAARQAAAAFHTVDRFVWLEDLAAELSAGYRGTEATPARLVDGIRLEGVGFGYPGSDRSVLAGLDLHLPAGTTVAVVGDNGTGKTSLVKLLTGMYRPTEGRITVDGVDLVALDVDGWRRRLGGTFQDFVRLEATAQHAVGVGDPAHVDDEDAVATATRRGGAERIVAGLPEGAATHLGRSYRDGAELSGGQWQRLALARGMMPPRPLLLVLDEPTAALDPVAEQALFDEYRRTAEQLGGEGTVTVLISHRFSSVRMADLIVVLDGGRVVESGPHADLLAAGGRYAHMYRQQASAYL